MPFVSNVVQEKYRFIQNTKNDEMEYKKTICIAHNSRGYDSRFILKHLESKSITPDKTIRANSGASIQRISLIGNRISFIDSLNFFNEPLSNLPKSYGIKDTVKGYFPHGFNTYENENYIGPIPDIKYYHPEYTKIINHKGKVDFTCYKNLENWHAEQVESNVVFDMKQELLKYCIDDCKVLLKAVLIFRNIIIDKTYDTIENDDGTLTELKFTGFATAADPTKVNIMS